jgi:transposase-like protein
LPIEVLGEADEIFQGRQPCLTLVDGRTFLVVNLSAQEHRDATTWGCVFLDAKNRGVRFANLVSDEAKGILAGVRAAELNVPVCPDLFHLMQDGKRISRRLEMRAYQAITNAERAQLIEQEK